jgi:pre-mRNA-splicing factor ATP-dependent RNA helicase DHX38/PRP16
MGHDRMRIEEGIGRRMRELGIIEEEKGSKEEEKLLFREELPQWELERSAPLKEVAMKSRTLELFRSGAWIPRRPEEEARAVTKEGVDRARNSGKARRGNRIEKAKEEIKRAVRENQVVVIKGGTGTGKTTRVPLFLMEEGINGEGLIGCTQPRRIAAISVAQRTRSTGAGYAVRFEGKRSRKVKYMTEGVLVREIIRDKTLSKYSVVILDEVHERSLDLEIITLHLLKLLRTRSDLKVLVMSASLSPSFVRVFGIPPVIEIGGREMGVNIVYKGAPEDYVEAAVSQAVELIKSREGNILLFMAGKEDIAAAVSLIESRIPQERPIRVLKLHSELPARAQEEAVQYKGRKCVVATNIAETSITIPDVRHVVDCGVRKMLRYIPEENTYALSLIPISKSSADQRAGRTGRTCEGTCYRMYTRKFYEEMEESDPSQTETANLDTFFLQLSLLQCDTSSPRLAHAKRRLWMLGAIDVNGDITALGRRVSALPLSPLHAKMVVESDRLNCALASIVILSTLSVSRDMLLSNPALSRYCVVGSDHLTLLNIYISYLEAGGEGEEWLERHSVDGRQMAYVKKSIDQMRAILGIRGEPEPAFLREAMGGVRKALASSFSIHTCKRVSLDIYQDYLTKTRAKLSRNSLFGSRERPTYIVYNEILEINGEKRVSVVTQLSSRELADASGHFYVE